MKKTIALALCLITTGMTYAQKTATTAQHAAAHKNGLSGFIKTARNVPIPGVQAFLYGTDSSGAIASSGYTDSMGYYETNFTYPGKYNLKLVYPSDKTLMINGVIVKKGLLDISLKMNPPENDTTLPYTYFIPKPVEKKRVKKTP